MQARANMQLTKPYHSILTAVLDQGTAPQPLYSAFAAHSKFSAGALGESITRSMKYAPLF
jgi:hypothetical protein